ncbi:MAG: carboxypeptidase-like regulatory domain-containing protein [Acidobacteria bacterium]|nr:carboxypeptidase-like regulatory domain-containing protein [Acidobacteriota bacterium]
MKPKRVPHRFRQAAPRGRVAALACALLFAAALAASAPGALAQKEAPSSVSGRVTDGERGVPGLTVTLLSADPAQRFRAVARGRTDGEGRFLITNVAPGRYQIAPSAPAYVVEGMTDSYPPGRPLTLLAGEEVKDFDFRVERGAVITGRVTDGDGNPVISEPVQVTPAEPGGQQPPRSRTIDLRDQMTDDRGVYRIYGLPPGRYRVSVGQAGDESGGFTLGRRRIFQRTFYPGVTEQAQARVVEVKAGDESENVDITLGRPIKTYKAAGRFVGAETGEPVPNIPYGYSALDASGRRVGSFGGGQATNARGEFSTEGLAPGRYVVFNMMGAESTEFYTEPAMFEIADADVSGVTVRVRRGASVSGVVHVEGVSDRALLARLLSQVRIFGYVESRDRTVPPFSSRPPGVNPDGTFRLGGLRPGKMHLSVSAEAAKGLSLARVELAGANVTRGFDIADGAQVTGVRVVLNYGTSVITGQISYVNGTPPAGSRAIAQARRAGVPADGSNARTVEVDARGLFRIEGLSAGEYEVIVSVFGAGSRGFSVPLSVSVPDGGETRIAPVVDFSAQPPPRGVGP